MESAKLPPELEQKAEPDGPLHFADRPVPIFICFCLAKIS